MISCSACKYENVDGAEACAACGEALVQYNNVCGMPMVAQSSRGQVLSMRYIIAEHLSEDDGGCTYSADDAADNTNVVIRALPLSISLDSGQIEQLKAAIETLKASSAPNTNGLKAFEVSGAVRFFVYADVKPCAAAPAVAEDGLQQYKDQIEELKADLVQERQRHAEFLRQADDLSDNERAKHRQAIEQFESTIAEQEMEFTAALREADSKVAALAQEQGSLQSLNSSMRQVMAKLRADAERQKQEHAAQLNEAAQTAEEETARRIQAERQCAAYEETIRKLEAKIAEQGANLRATLDEVEQRLEREKQAREELEANQGRYEQQIEQLTSRIAAEEEKHAAALEKATWKMEALTASLADADKRVAEMTGRQDRPAEPSGLKYAEQLEKAQWKIKALAAEIERLERQHEKRADAPVPARRFSAAPLLLTLVLGIACGSGLTYVAVKQTVLGQKFGAAATSVGTVAQDANSVFAASVNEAVTQRQILDVLSPASLADQTQEKAETPEHITEVINPEQPQTSTAQSEALYRVSEAYLNGAQPNESLEEVAEQLKVAADANDPNAVCELALMHYAGHGVEKDADRALSLFLEAANAGNSVAMYNAARIYHEGEVGAADGKKAVQWFEKAADAGLTKAMNQLAQMYFFGDVVRQDYQKAAEYYELSATAGDPKGMYNLAVLHQTGVGVEQDIRKAMLWLIKAARAGDADSMYRLGLTFESGAGIEKDVEKAVYWYEMAAKAGRDDAKQQLAKLGRSR